MGSVVISDVVSDVARYPRTMVNSDDRYSATNRSHGSQSSIQSYNSQRHSSNSNSQSDSRTGPSAHITTPINIPGSRRSTSQQSSRSNLATGTVRPHQANPSAYDEQYGDADVYEERGGVSVTNARQESVHSPPSPRLLPTLRSSLSLSGSGSASPNRIKVRDLSHIHSFASEEVLTRSRHGSRRSLRSKHDGGQQYEISAMPVTDIIEMVAGLLTKITTTNDHQHQHENIHKNIPSPDGTSALNQQTSSVLSFHGKNVPSITILSYLSRIHKYCPTTYEVFLSLLVYFDRMTEMVNNGILRSFQSAAACSGRDVMSPKSTASYETDSVHEPRTPGSAFGTSSRSRSATKEGSDSSPSGDSLTDTDDESTRLAHCFVVDSFNIHRLVIAGVTCASKFFSDVFYTNSRYAKVCSCLPTFHHLLGERLSHQY